MGRRSTCAIRGVFEGVLVLRVLSGVLILRCEGGTPERYPSPHCRKARRHSLRYLTDRKFRKGARTGRGRSGCSASHCARNTARIPCCRSGPQKGGRGGGRHRHRRSQCSTWKVHRPRGHKTLCANRETILRVRRAPLNIGHCSMPNPATSRALLLDLSRLEFLSSCFRGQATAFRVLADVQPRLREVRRRGDIPPRPAPAHRAGGSRCAEKGGRLLHGSELARWKRKNRRHRTLRIRLKY